jgi:membrane protease YdiL (CAAX protease family)
MDTTVEDDVPPADPGTDPGPEGGPTGAGGSDDTDPGVLGRLRSIGVAAGLAIGGFLLAIVVFVPVGISVFLFDVRLSAFDLLLMQFLVLQGFVFPVVAVADVKLRGLPWDFLGIGVPGLRDAGAVLGGYVLIIVLATAVLTAVALVDLPTAERTDQEAYENPTALLAMVPLSFLVIGPGEELLFRGVIQGRLRETFSAPAAILLASAMFAPAHVLALTGGLVAVAVSIGTLFVPSLVFGATYELTDNLAVPSVIHGAYNATIFGSMYVVNFL